MRVQFVIEDEAGGGPPAEMTQHPVVGDFIRSADYSLHFVTEVEYVLDANRQPILVIIRCQRESA